ncbi:ABC transporter substrate-binding protein [Thauera sinica]|uniref:ABC transporter substrate-binding protein n=1 Tax=Thauera sinica TaxID=2665146 RepID=A0ABW1ATK8_9RHOO|nr:ABC transporter substrate-binding protein [Thauera sp. K11]
MMRLCVCLVCMLLLLSGCGEPPRAVLRVGVSPWVGYDPLVLAGELGLVDARRVRVVEVGSSSESLRGLRNGVLEAAALTLDEALRLADEGMAIRIVALLSLSDGADAVVARPPVATPADLRGKRIAVEDSAVGALVLARVLQAGKLERGDVSVLRVEASRQRIAAGSGNVDAVVAYEPIASLLRADGARTIFDSRRMPGEIVGLLVVCEGVLAERGDDVVELLAGWERGLAALRADTAGHAALLAPGIDLTAEQYHAILGGLTFLTLGDSVASFEGRAPAIAAAGRRTAESLREMGLIHGSGDWSALLAAEPARQALGGAR